MNELNHLYVELPGTHLIEASAGTGKTYAIAILYLRLLVEMKLSPQQILVVTYTEAATKELRGRIRARIREAIQVLKGCGTTDPLLEQLCNNGNGRWGDSKETLKILDAALNLFDTASIFTIHGFSLRVLKETPFESGSRFDTELTTDQRTFLQESVDDFWRSSFFTESPPLLGYLLKQKLSPKSLLEFVTKMVLHPALEIRPTFNPEQIEKMENDAYRQFTLIQQEWSENANEVMAILNSDKSLSRDKSKKFAYPKQQLPEYQVEMELFTKCSNPFDLPKNFYRFCQSSVIKGTKDTGTAPKHNFFESCEELQKLVEERLCAFKWEMILYCKKHITSLKSSRNTRFFDDLLNDLHKGLQGGSGELLASTLRGKYSAALIDEFQDTDPVQYEIFKNIFATAGLPLFLIGDPKQAIYSFRGADIFAYIQAADDVPKNNRYTLTSNWRSTPSLLEGFNTIFDNSKNPFLFEQIAYHPLSSGKGKSEILTDRGGISPPLQIWSMPSDNLTVTKARELIPLYVSAEISRLLHGGKDGATLIENKPVLPGDIAVIVRSHRQGEEIKNALVALKIPNVMRSDMTIFATDEAAELCTILHSITHPENEPTLRGALVTKILGWNGNDIAHTLECENEWEEIVERFRNYRQIWIDKGFMVMSRQLLKIENIRGRLLRYPDGERRLTNLLHAIEVIHSKTCETYIGMEGVATWFGEKVSAKEKSEEHEIRLETDEKAVKIQTIHVSKGLEYPIVFCPYLWTGLHSSDEVINFHIGNRMIKDFGSDERGKYTAVAEKEALAESLRLLYVAVTRAKYRCYLYGGKVVSKSDRSRPETSPMAYLFYASSECRTKEDVVSALAAHYGAISGDDLLGELKAIASENNKSILAAELPERVDPAIYYPEKSEVTDFKARQFSGNLKGDWRVTSFSALVNSNHDARITELPDREQTIASNFNSTGEVYESSEENDIFHFPRGMQAGNLMHDIFEHLDFAKPTDEHIKDLTTKTLVSHNFDQIWSKELEEMVRTVITTELPSPDGNGTCKLSSLKKGEWRTEIDFFFPLNYITSDKLLNIIRSSKEDFETIDLLAALKQLNFKPVRGMLKGSIDMVFHQNGRFYLLDWKSNHLGFNKESYNKVTIQREMIRNFYHLQYLLYTVALNRYLKLRLPGYSYEKDFGGVYYLFLRGMKNAEQYGIFTDIPSLNLLNKLTDLLVRSEGGES